MASGKSVIYQLLSLSISSGYFNFIFIIILIIDHYGGIFQVYNMLIQILQVFFDSNARLINQLQ